MILNPQYQFTDTARYILTEYIINGKTYSELGKELNLKPEQISNMITDDIRKMDMYRLGVIIPTIYKEEQIDNFLKENQTIYTKTQIHLIKEKFINGKTKYEITQNKKEQEELEKLFNHFSRKIKDFLTKNIMISKDEYKQDIQKMSINSILNEKEKTYISYYYGIKSSYNPTGKHLTITEITNQFSELKSESSTKQQIKKIEKKMKLVKGGLSIPTYGHFTKKEIESILKDSHLPITKKEREILSSLFGVNGYQRKTVEELCEKFKMTESSFCRRYQRTILAIKKYQNHELEPMIDYQTDILPISNLFTSFENKLLYDIYKNNLSIKQLTEKYTLTVDQVRILSKQLKMEIIATNNNTELKRTFDFIKAYTIMNRSDFPYSGDKTKALEAYGMFFGENGYPPKSSAEIMKKLDYKTNSIDIAMHQLIISVCKYQVGIKKENSFSKKDILDILRKHKKKFNSQELYQINSYLENGIQYQGLNKELKKLPDDLVYKLLSLKQPNHIVHLNKLSKKDILSFLFSYQLSPKTIETLISYYQLKPNDFKKMQEESFDSENNSYQIFIKKH